MKSTLFIIWKQERSKQLIYMYIGPIIFLVDDFTVYIKINLQSASTEPSDPEGQVNLFNLFYVIRNFSNYIKGGTKLSGPSAMINFN